MQAAVNYEAKLAEVASACEAARAQRDEMIREAADKGGLSRRKIATAVGLSSARVQQIIRRGA